MNLTDDWLLEHQHQDRANFQLAMYATHLATGSTLHFRNVKASTIAGYLHDVATFLGRYRTVDPRFVSTTDTKLAPVIAKVLDEQKRWEQVPNRREPFNLDLQVTIANFPAAKADLHSLEAGMANWTLCNLYAGCRGIEWAQTNCTHRPLTTFHRNRFGNAYAFTLADVQCFTEMSCPVLNPLALTNPEMVAKIKLRFEE